MVLWGQTLQDSLNEAYLEKIIETPDGVFVSGENDYIPRLYLRQREEGRDERRRGEDRVEGGGQRGEEGMEEGGGKGGGDGGWKGIKEEGRGEKVIRTRISATSGMTQNDQ